MGVRDDSTVDAASANPPAEDYAGRRDLPDLVQAYRQSGHEAVRQRERADRAEAMLQAAAAANPRQEVQQRAVDPYGELESIGLPSSHLKAAIRQEVLQEFTPVINAIQGQQRARTHMLASYGNDFVKFEQDVAQHLESDPALQQRFNQMFATDPVAATEYAFLKFGEERRRSMPQNGDNGQTREQQAQAAVPGNRSADNRNPQNAYQDGINRAWEAYQANPNRFTAEQYAKVRFGGIITDEFLNQ